MYIIRIKQTKYYDYIANTWRDLAQDGRQFRYFHVEEYEDLPDAHFGDISSADIFKSIKEAKECFHKYKDYIFPSAHSAYDWDSLEICELIFAGIHKLKIEDNNDSDNTKTCKGCGYFDEDTKTCKRSSENPNLPTVRMILDMYDDWNHLTRINNHSLEPLQEAKTDVIVENSPWLDNKVISFGVYPYSEEDSTPLLGLRINHCKCDDLDKAIGEE